MREFNLFKYLHSAILIYLMTAGHSLTAQYNTNFLNYSATGRSVGFNMDFEAGSNGIKNGMVNKLMFGGYIGDGLKNNSARAMRAINNFGIHLNYDLSAFLKGNKNFDFHIGVKEQSLLNATFTKDFYNLMFYGNRMYKGQTASLKNSNVNALRFQEFKFGVMMHSIDTIGKIGVAVSVLRGEQLFFIKTFNNSSLSMSEDGSEVAFYSDFSMAISDTASVNRFANFKGIGASADLYFETPYKSKIGQSSVLIVSANNIGFIHWGDNSVQYSSDSLLRFSGYTVNSLEDLKDSTLRRIDADSLVQRLTSARKESFNVNIPTNLLLINKIKFSSRYTLVTGYRYIFNANYKAYFFTESEITYRKITGTLHIGYGGYGRLNVGVSLSYNNPNWYLKIGSNSLQGFLAPKNTYNQGVFLSFARKLK